jgi:hypothetical protein
MWGARPSEFLRVEDDYVGYCLDQAVGFFGSFIESELEQAEERVRSRKGKTRESAIKQARMRVLRQYGIQAGQTEARQFADPALLM